MQGDDKETRMTRKWFCYFICTTLAATLLLAGCGSDGKNGLDGSDGFNGIDGVDGLPGATGAAGTPGDPGTPGTPGDPGPPAFALIDAATAPPEYLELLDVEMVIDAVTLNGVTTVDFTVMTDQGVPITGLGYWWEQSNRFIRMTFSKLLPGANGDPNTWVDYIRNASGTPTYDSGASVVDNGDGTYVFTFSTDVQNVPGIPYEPGLTHRVAGQLGQTSTVPIEEQNFFYDFVPDGSAIVTTRSIVTMDACNECHDGLRFHGRRFITEYCVTCHNPDLAMGEGDMPYMIHHIHSSQAFMDLDGGIDYSEVTYPQDVTNCRKCHNGDEPETPDGDNWRSLPNLVACDGCHNVFTDGTHTGGPQADNSGCSSCHPATSITEYHTTSNSTPNNPELPMGQRNIAYELTDASVDGANNVVINFRITSDGAVLDLTNLPTDLATPARWPGFLLAYAMSQDGIAAPTDYNNLGRDAGQPLSVSLGDFPGVGTLSCDVNGCTATITDPASQFPAGATLRRVGLQGYFQQDIDGDGTYDASLHAISAIVDITGDEPRRRIVNSTSCAECHEWFEGHGGNRVWEMDLCVMCHNPNLSSSGRSIGTPNASLVAELGPDPLTYPEDSQNMRDMIHGIHSSAFRTRDYEHVRGGRQGYYDWAEVTFPAEDGTANCTLCHDWGDIELPLSPDLLPTTVRTTGVADGMDATTGDVATAIDNVPNATDWINTPTASSCFYCHTGADAMAHMVQNGALLTLPDGTVYVSRPEFGTSYESCAVCHGPGKVGDVRLMHNR